MTLNQKINDALFYIEPKVSITKCEQIAEEFAIGFAEWVIKKEYHIDICIKNNSIKELLEIYKNTL